jgi:eight-cysteine-cluster-containing protein
LLFVALAAVVAGCQNAEPVDDVILETECSTDSDCAVAGCSAQICTTAEEAPGMLTTCEYKEAYSCLELTGCGCVKGACAWAQTDEYVSCLEQVEGN